MNLAQSLRKAENNLKCYQQLVAQAKDSYSRLLMADDGTHRNHWESVERARKDLEKLTDGKRHWVRVLTKLEQQIQQISFASH